MKNPDVESAAREHFDRIHRAAFLLTGNPWDADDLAQETFLVFARQRHRFERRSSLYTFLYGIMLNLDRRERRRRGMHRTKLNILSETLGEAKTAPSAETPIEVAQWKRSLWSCVAELPDGQRHALILRFSEHLSYQDIAAALDCPLGTVKSRIFNGLAALRKIVVEGSDARMVPKYPLEDVNHAV